MSNIESFNDEKSVSRDYLIYSTESIQNQLHNVSDKDISELQSKEDLLELFRRNYMLVKDNPNAAQEWVNKTYKRFPESNKKILQFIANILFHQGFEASDVIYRLFASGYCYYLACMLKEAFGGTVCWHVGYGHIVYTDDVEITDTSIFYDIGGIFEDYGPGEVVPVEELGSDLESFLHRR